VALSKKKARSFLPLCLASFQRDLAPNPFFSKQSRMRQRSRRCLSVTVSYFPSSRSLPSRLLERRYAGIIHTPSPNPSWKPGDKISSPVNEMVLIDAHTTSPAQMYKLMIGSIIPRPIAFVSTKSQAGLLNLAPFRSEAIRKASHTSSHLLKFVLSYSFFNGVSSNPPCIMFSVCMTPERKINFWDSDLGFLSR